MGREVTNVIIALAVGLVCGWWLTMLWYECQPETYRQAEWETRVDTVKYEMPVVRDSMVIRYEVCRLAKAGSIGGGGAEHSRERQDGENTGQTGRAPRFNEEEGRGQDTVLTPRAPWLREGEGYGEGGDSVWVEVPIEQRMYESTEYRAWVSGYKPRLDSISVVRRHEYERPISTPKRWHIGITAGYGIGPKGCQPYVGIGLTYSLYGF